MLIKQWQILDQVLIKQLNKVGLPEILLTYFLSTDLRAREPLAEIEKKILPLKLHIILILYQVFIFFNIFLGPGHYRIPSEFGNYDRIDFYKTMNSFKTIK